MILTSNNKVMNSFFILFYFIYNQIFIYIFIYFKMQYIGVHKPLNDTLINNFHAIMKHGGNFMQIFIGSP